MQQQPSERRATRRTTVAVVGIVALAVLVTGAGVAAIVTRSESPSDDTARAAFTELIGRRDDAYIAGDLGAFMGTVDPARAFLRECSRQRFETYSKLPLPTGTPPPLTIGRIERWGDYVEVWLDTEIGWHRYFMRSQGGHWFISEPFPSQFGENQITEYAGVKLHYQAGDADLARIIGADLEAIVTTVLRRAAEPPSQMFEVRIATLSDPGGECFVLGVAEDYGTTIITLRDVRLGQNYDHIAADTASTLEHEALHWLQMEHEKRQRMRQDPDWWVIEGWPTSIAESPSTSERHDAICGSPPSFEDLRHGMRVGASTKQVGVAYVVAAMLVERVAGSDDSAYWRFFDDFGATTDPYLRATGSDGASFYAKWLEGARAQYC